jgi:hypothetical protein
MADLKMVGDLRPHFLNLPFLKFNFPCRISEPNFGGGDWLIFKVCRFCVSKTRGDQTDAHSLGPPSPVRDWSVAAVRKSPSATGFWSSLVHVFLSPSKGGQSDLERSGTRSLLLYAMRKIGLKHRKEGGKERGEIKQRYNRADRVPLRSRALDGKASDGENAHQSRGVGVPDFALTAAWTLTLTPMGISALSPTPL